MFTLKQMQIVDFYQAGEAYSAPSEFARTNKGVLLMLQHQPSQQVLVVANAQLYHGSERDYIREAQSLYLLQQASSFINEYNLTKA